MGFRAAFFFAALFFSLSATIISSASAEGEPEVGSGLVMNFYKDTCLRLRRSLQSKSSFSTSATRTLHSLGSGTSSMTVLFNLATLHCFWTQLGGISPRKRQTGALG
ncbi:Peroxidase [Psidium guajava]|nr:Peroxidase [Psidium guajava]